MAAEEWARKPLDIVHQHFKEGKLDNVSEYFKSKLADSEIKLPLLSSATSSHYLPPDGSLVRYRGMVQDQFDPEFYLKVFSITNQQTTILYHGMYQDKITLPEGYEIDNDSSSNVSSDCHTLYVVPIPGETEWVQKLNGNCTNESISSVDGNTSCNIKRPLEDDTECEMDVDEEVSYAVAKKQRTHLPVANGDKKPFDHTHFLHHPLPNETRVSCLVKVYDNETIPVNSLVEFVGILSTDPTLTSFEGEEDTDIVDPFSSETLAERRSHHPPPSLVPRLHCLFAVTLSHSNPLLPSLSLPLNTTQQSLRDFGCDVRFCRETLINILMNVCHGDSLAAEYILLHLLSSVFGRTNVMALGKFSLNVSSCPVGFTDVLYKLLQELVVKCYCLPLSLSNLNSINFVPYKDYSDNRLHSGILQLSKGTHLLVDELAMTQGQLNEKGIANLKALGGLIKWQRVKYDFKYHLQDFDVDIPVLITSEGKSIINVDCHIPLQCVSSPSIANELPSDIMNQLRCYLTLCAGINYQLQTDMQKHLEKDFVEMRRKDSKMNAEAFHHLLSLARLVAISNGEANLSLSDWEHAKRLYINRMTRLN